MTGTVANVIAAARPVMNSISGMVVNVLAVARCATNSMIGTYVKVNANDVAQNNANSMIGMVVAFVFAAARCEH
jgi:hypothetical protein